MRPLLQKEILLTEWDPFPLLFFQDTNTAQLVELYPNSKEIKLQILNTMRETKKFYAMSQDAMEEGLVRVEEKPILFPHNS